MENIFLHLLNMSITASWIALAVIVLRFLLKKAPKWIMGVLWSFVALRLICPFSFESVFSLIPSAETVPIDITVSNAPVINSGIPFINQAVNPVISDSLTPNVADSVNPLQVIVLIASIVWVIGIAAMLIYTAASYLLLHRKVREAVIASDGVWVCDHISTPFILGLFRTKIYLPSSMNEADMSYVLSHEKAHLKRRDYIWKPLGFLLLAVYWFNPVLWIAYILLCRDIELACDERVIRDMGENIKKPYSEALINCSVPRRMIAACPLAFGEVGVRGRIKNVLNYKKPAFWIIIVALVACIVTAVCLLTNPMSTKIDDELSAFLDNTIVSQNSGSKTGDNFITVDYKILEAKKSGTKTTAYLWVLYQEYSFDGELKEETGSHIPTVITANKTGNTDGDSYELIDYWTPRDGSYYADDIKSKFPMTLWSKALDSQWCIEEQQTKCLKSAQDYYGISISTVGGEDGPSDVTYFPDKDSRTYTFNSSVESVVKPSFSLSSDGNSFGFVYSALSSYIPIGRYELTEDTLTLKTDDGNNIYVFNVKGDTFVFDASKSSEIPKFVYSRGAKPECPVPDGAVFE